MSNMAPAGRSANAPAGGLGQESASPVTLFEMIDLAHDEAMRIEHVQEMLVRTGQRKAPDAQQLRKMEVWQATVTLLETIERNKEAVRQALSPARQRNTAVDDAPKKKPARVVEEPEAPDEPAPVPAAPAADEQPDE